jgi:EAL domain-containing protein (putative c-di-GMP-specific phosphodiesterase class I)/GGDEF domain-containing protein
MSGDPNLPTLPRSGPGAPGLWLYSTLARRVPISYRNKIMLIAFAGTHVPLLVLVTWYATTTSASLDEALRVIAVALAATLAGTAVTLIVLHQLLRPILLASQALQDYTADRRLPSLPVGFRDEAGTLMGDTVRTLTRLDTVLDTLAYVDTLTGLPNHDRMLRQLGERLANGHRLALCVIALRNADRITAGFGAAAADLALRLLAARLDSVAGHGGIVARLEGPRLALVLDADLQDLSPRLAELLAVLGPEITHGDMTLLPDLGIGVAMAPEDATEAATLLSAARAAVACVTQAGHEFYSPKAQAAARRRMDLERELRRAMERDELSLHFQPVVKMTAGSMRPRIVGAEALLRWRHPTEGMIPPGIFIPVAEQCGLMDPIGLWVLRTGCRQLRLWDEAGLPSLRLAVNLSARQFSDRRLVRSIGDALASEAVPAHRLEIEMTESAAMQDREMTSRVFGDLHALGATVAIDDFGTGYSTMSHLRDLRFDTLKIDQEFVRGVESSSSGRAICKALIELANGLDIEVLAEGVETADEVQLLHNQGCRVFQGFYFGRPMPQATFGAMVRATPEAEAGAEVMA